MLNPAFSNAACRPSPVSAKLAVQQPVGHDHRPLYTSPKFIIVQTAGAAYAQSTFEVPVNAGLNLVSMIRSFGNYVPHHKLWATQVDLTIL
jgi:hypothetical protein